MKRRNRVLVRLGMGLLGLLAVMLLLLLLPSVRSMAVMSVYSAWNAKDSLNEESGLQIQIPGGLSTPEKDWYPFVMTFQDDLGFSAFCGRTSRLTILYNFGAFDLFKGSSTLYQEDSPYYSSFYGAYLVQQEGHAFGFTDEGTIDSEEIAMVPYYDFFYLVLDDFGLDREDRTFDWSVTGLEENITQAGLEGWTRIEAELTVNGAGHQADDFVTSYLQYGAPAGVCTEPFAPISMKGILYARYFPEEDVSVFLYALCADEEALVRCDRDILSQTQIR